MVRLLTVLSLLLISFLGKAQTATIKARKVFPNAKDTVNYIQFTINGQSFGEQDTLISIQINEEGLEPV